MIVCLCNPFSDKTVQKYLENTPTQTRVSAVYGACSDGGKPQCCSCLETLKDMVKTHNRSITKPAQ
jgi:bacterioferritin-associated ferredoxin